MECAICLDRLRVPYTLPCNHSFHESCIEQCINEVCPLCRSPFHLSVDIYVLVLSFHRPINKANFRVYPDLLLDAVKCFNVKSKVIVFYFREKELRDLWWSRLVLQNELGADLDTQGCDTDQILVHIKKL